MGWPPGIEPRLTAAATPSGVVAPDGAAGDSLSVEHPRVHVQHRHRPQPPDAPPRWAAQREPPLGRGRLRGDADHRPGQRVHHRRATTRAWPPAWSTSCACCSSRARAVDPQVVHRTIDMVRADERPSEVLTAEVLRSARGRSVRPKTSGQKRYADAIRDNDHHLRHRPGRDRQELPGRRPGRAGPPGQAGGPDHPDPAGGGGRGAARASCPGTSWPRSTPTCGPSTTPSTTCSAPRGPGGCSRRAPSRWPRSPTCGAAPSTTASSSSTRPRTPRPSR